MVKLCRSNRWKVLIVLLLIPVLLFTALVVAAGFSGFLSWNRYGLVFKEVAGGYSIDRIDWLYGLFAKSVDIPNTYKGKPVVEIGEHAFSLADNIKSITIPDSVTSIGDSAFSVCHNLTSITFEGTKAQWKQISKGHNWNYNTGEYTVYCTNGEISKK